MCTQNAVVSDVKAVGTCS